MLNTVSVRGTDGTARVFYNQPLPTANTASAVIFHYEVNAAVLTAGHSTSFSAFDELVNSLEMDPKSAAQLSDGRKWVSEAFYSKPLTLASLRLAAGLSQRQFGLACGIEQPHVSRYESGRSEPSLSTAAAMARALNVNLEDFFLAWNNTRGLLQMDIS